MDRLVIGSRGSRLALRQTEMMKEAIEKLRPEVPVTVKVIVTQGDREQQKAEPLPGKAIFVKEIEEQLLARQIDLAVHSMKDVPAELPQGLRILAVPRREDPRDVLLTRDGRGLSQLKKGAVVGTSSLRRMALLRAARPDIQIRPLRGNVDTRVRKLVEHAFDGVVLAQAGLKRLGFPDLQFTPLDPQVCLPAPGQGALALEGREDDEELARLLAPLDDPETAICTTAERAFLRRLGGSCRIPAGALARFEGSMLELDGLVASLDGTRIIRSTLMGDPTDAAGIGIRLADALKALGAADLLIEAERG